MEPDRCPLPHLRLTLLASLTFLTFLRILVPVRRGCASTSQPTIRIFRPFVSGDYELDGELDGRATRDGVGVAEQLQWHRRDTNARI